MKKVMLLGVIALGSMSFTAVDCFKVANDSQAQVESIVPLNDQQRYDVWNAVFNACVDAGGTGYTAEPVEITVKK